MARVLMGKRHARHRFMPGKFVFPGGRVEPEDRRMAAAGVLDPHVEEKLNARVRRPSPNFARALALAAIRETFEETGLADRRPWLGRAGLAARRLDPLRRDGRSSGARRHRLPRPRDHPARALQALRCSLSHRRRALHRRARRRRRSFRGGIGRTRLDAARRSEEPRSAHDHARSADDLRRSRRSKAAWTNAGHDPSIARSEANGCASSCKAGLGAAPQAANRTGGNRPASSISAR